QKDLGRLRETGSRRLYDRGDREQQVLAHGHELGFIGSEHVRHEVELDSLPAEIHEPNALGLRLDHPVPVEKSPNALENAPDLLGVRAIPQGERGLDEELLARREILDPGLRQYAGGYGHERLLRSAQA